MIRWQKPTDGQIHDFLARQATLPFSYRAVGETRQTPPPTYVLDHHRVRLGEGQAVFERAKDAIQHWQMFDLGWVQLCWPDAPLTVGMTVGILAHALGLWSLNACRIVYLIDEHGAGQRFARYGFAYGTLPAHMARGEERFLVEWDHLDDTVWYDILAFSQPQQWLAKVGYPVVRLLQKQFARASMRAMGGG